MSLRLPKSQLCSGKPLVGEAREIVYNVATYLRKQKRLYKLYYNVVESTSAATGVSMYTVYRILREGKELAAKGKLTFCTPKGKRKPRKKRIQVDDDKKSAIREKIQELQTLKGEAPTLRELTKALNQENILNCSTEYLRCLLKSLGLRNAKRHVRRKVQTENSDSDDWEDKDKEDKIEDIKSEFGYCVKIEICNGLSCTEQALTKAEGRLKVLMETKFVEGSTISK